MAKNDKKPPAAPSADEDAFLAQLTQQLMAGGGATAKAPSYLGLPGGDETSVQTMFTERPQGQRAPRYHVGYAYLPQVDNWDPIAKKRLQTRLVNAGLLAGDFRYGAWDEPTANAFSTILSMANQSGNEWEQELVNYYNQQPMEYDAKTGKMKRKGPPGGAGSGGSIRERQPLKVTHTDPNDLGRVANEVAEKRLGRRFTSDELNRFVQTYQGQETHAQTQSWNTEYEGGAVTAPPSPETAATMHAEAVDPVAATTRNALPLVESINQMLSGFSFGQEEAMNQ